MSHTILIVDDHAETRRLITTTLEEESFAVLNAATGAEGIQLARDERPDLILLDVSMPEMDGLEVCRRLRANPELVATPIIMFSANSRANQKWASFAAGADDYLIKPVPPAELVNRVETLLAARAGEPLPAVPAADSAPLAPPPDSGPLGDPRAGREGRVVAVMGARGGSGATTTAINLASSLAVAGHATVLVDLDRVQGHIAAYLDLQSPRWLQSLYEPPAERATLEATLVNYGENLQLLLTQADLQRQMPFPTPDEAVGLCDALRGGERTVIVDLGHELTPVAEGVLGTADHILICLQPERVALTAARYLLLYLPELAMKGTPLSLLMLDFSGGVSLPQNLVENFLGRPLLDVLYFDYQELAQAANHAQPLVMYHPNISSAQKLRKIAQQLVVAAPTP